MTTLVSFNAAEFRIPFYNRLAAEHGVRIVLIMTKPGAAPQGLHPAIETVQGQRLFGTIWPVRRIELNTKDPVACIFDLRLMPWLILTGALSRTVLWGIGMGRRRPANWLRKHIVRHSAGQLAYMPRGMLAPHDDGGIHRLSRYVLNSVFVERPTQLWAPSQKLVFMGTIDRRKRLDVAIHSLCHLRDMGMDWRLDVIGVGSDLGRCRAIAKRLDVDQQITWHGRVREENRKREILQDAFFVVLPGQAGLSVLESFAYGLPVLSWSGAVSGGEIDMIVDGVTGYTEQRLCPVMMANRIGALSTSPELVRKMSEQCFATYRNTASGEHMLDRFVDALQTLQSS